VGAGEAGGREERGFNPQALLDGQDSASFFAPLGDLLNVGPSFTNVNDFRAMLLL